MAVKKAIWRMTVWTLLKSIILSARYLPGQFFHLHLPIICTRRGSIEVQHGARLWVNKGRLSVGVQTTQLSDNRAVLRVRTGATASFSGVVRLGPGVHVIVGKNATFKIGSNTYIAADSKIFVSEQVTIGNDCALAWDITIIDTDFHEYSNEGIKASMKGPISIGNHVWVG